MRVSFVDYQIIIPICHLILLSIQWIFLGMTYFLLFIYIINYQIPLR